jgi:hypothetical protein
MAILLIGKTECPICGMVIKEAQEVVCFPNFVANKFDPLWMFSDGAFHANCFYDHPLAEKALARYAKSQEHTGPGKRFCAICDKEIKDPDNYFAVGHLTEEPSDPLYRYNYLQAHASCLATWPERLRLLAEVERLLHSGRWGGDSLARILAELSRATVINR